MLVVVLVWAGYKYIKYLISVFTPNSVYSGNSGKSIKVEVDPSKDQKIFKGGEYIDFEELK